jgi:hypothetical protein
MLDQNLEVAVQFMEKIKIEFNLKLIEELIWVHLGHGTFYSNRETVILFNVIKLFQAGLQKVFWIKYIYRQYFK